MKARSMRLLAAVLVIVMVMGVLSALPISTSAYSSSDAGVKDGTVTGAKLPEGAEVYDGKPATSFAGGTGTQEDPYLISNAKEFVYFRDVHVPSLLDTRVVVSSFTAGSSDITYTKTVTDAEGNSTSEEKTVTIWKTEKIRTTCAVEEQNKQLYYKLTGDIYLNNETYGSSNKGYHLNGISKNIATTDYIEIRTNENSELYVADTTPTGDGTHTTVIHNADGTTTTYTSSANSQISITSTIKFDGTLDGDGHTIYNMYEYVGSHENGDYGMFHTLNGTVKNLNIAGLRFGSGYGDQERHKFGGIASYLYGTVQNVHVTHANLYTNSALGCIAGEAKAGAKVIDCSADGFVEGRYSAGYGGGTVAGGLIGRANQAGSAVLVQNCVNYATISARGRVAQGGIIGQISSTVNLLDCANYGDIVTYTTDAVSTRNAGGIVGSISGAATATTLSRCTNYASITSVRDAGGIVGNIHRNNGTKINILLTDCTNYGKIEGNEGAGGIVGIANAAGTPQLTLTNCVNSADVKGVKSVGGLVGKNAYGNEWNDGTIAFYNCVTSGNIEATTSHAAFAVGSSVTVYNGTAINMKNFIATGTVTAPTYVSAITGSQTALRGNSTTIQLENVWIHGQLIATADDARIAVISADANTTSANVNNVYHATHKISVIAKNSGFAVTDKNGDSVAVGTWCTTNVEGTEATGSNQETITANMVQYVATTYNNGTENVEGAYPTFDAANLTDSVTRNALNNMASANGYTPWIQDETAPTLVTTLGISGATMTLGGSMKLNMKLKETELSDFTDPLVYVMDADTDVAIPASVDGNGYFSASFDTRAAEMAKEMNLCLAITIGSNTYVCTNVLTYSPAIYLTHLYAQYADDAEIVTVVENMLAYGAVAEANEAGITDLTTTATSAAATAAGITLSTEFTYTQDQYTVADVMTDDDKALINAHATIGVGATLTGGITLSLNGMTPGDTVTVSFRDVSETYTAGDDGIIVIDTLHAGLLLDTITLTFTDGTARIALGNYLDARMADSELLAKATINYMMAVYAYMLTH